MRAFFARVWNCRLHQTCGQRLRRGRVTPWPRLRPLPSKFVRWSLAPLEDIPSACVVFVRRSVGWCVGCFSGSNFDLKEKGSSICACEDCQGQKVGGKRFA